MIKELKVTASGDMLDALMKKKKQKADYEPSLSTDTLRRSGVTQVGVSGPESKEIRPDFQAGAAAPKSKDAGDKLFDYKKWKASGKPARKSNLLDKNGDLNPRKPLKVPKHLK